jgi:hypothetical protein
MSDMRLALALSATSIVLSIAAIIFLTFYGIAYSNYPLDFKEVKTGDTSYSFYVEFEPLYLVWFFLSILGFIGILKRNGKVLWTSAVVMFLITILTFFSVGLPFLPASFLLLSAAIVYRSRLQKWKAM